jgi:hypothetical protein
MAKLGVAVWHSLEGTGQSSVAGSSEVVVDRDGISRVRRVKSLGGSNENVRLNKDLSAITGIDSIRNGIEVGVEEVAGTEADGWCAGVNVVPVVVILRNAEMSGVLTSVGIGVPDQRCLPVVMDIGVRDGDVVCSMSEIDQTIIVVLVMVTIR